MDPCQGNKPPVETPSSLPSDSTPNKLASPTVNAERKSPPKAICNLCLALSAHSKDLLSLKSSIEKLEASIITFTLGTQPNETSATSDTGTSEASTPTSEDLEMHSDGSNTSEKKTRTPSKRVKYRARNKGISHSRSKGKSKKLKSNSHSSIPKISLSHSPELGKTLDPSQQDKSVKSIQLQVFRPIPLKVPIGIPVVPASSSVEVQEQEKPSSPNHSSPRYVEHFALSGIKKPSKRTMGPRRSYSTISASIIGNEKTSSTSSTARMSPKSMSSTQCVPSPQGHPVSLPPTETVTPSLEIIPEISASQEESFGLM